MKLKAILKKLLMFPYNRYRDYIGRPLNQKHCYDYPAENNGWKKQGLAPVWGNCEMGTMFDPYCFFDNDLFKMVVSDRGNKCLKLISSVDGKKWGDCKVLLKGMSGQWDDDVNRGCLLKSGNRWLLWYTGQRNGLSRIGLAESFDCISFKKVQPDPVLQPDLLQEGLSVMNPCVLWDENERKFKMWYSAGENYEPDVIFFAESDDGVSWKKKDKPVLTKSVAHRWECYKIGGCQVLKNADGSYEMYYIGYQNLDVARICVAHSRDGLDWVRNDMNLLLSPSENSWDSDAVYKPTVVKKYEKSYLWYNGRRGHEEYVGLAIKE